MSTLRSALDELALVNSEDLTVEERHGVNLELLWARERIEVLLAESTHKTEDQGGHLSLGYPSPTAYLAHQGQMSFGHARQIVARANAKDRAPAAFAAWADGRLSTDQVTELFAAAEALPDLYPEAEEALVEIIEGLSVSDTARAVEYWRQSQEGPGQLDLESQMIRRGISLSKTIEGMRRVDGWMTGTCGEAFETVLDALMPPPRDGDNRTPRQRRHDALEDLCRDWLDHADTPDHGGEKPHMMVLGDPDALQGIAGGLHETLNGDIINIDTLRMLACDSSVSRIILGPDSEILDIGRKTRVWTPAQRRAIIARDRHCQAEEGCDVKPRYCDIHHTDHWADGGETSVEKGKLYCRFHHTREHLKDALKRLQQRKRRT